MSGPCKAAASLATHRTSQASPDRTLEHAGWSGAFAGTRFKKTGAYIQAMTMTMITSDWLYESTV